MKYEVYGTTRTPEGDVNGKICELLVRMPDGPQIIAKAKAVEMAKQGLLYSNDARNERILVVPVHPLHGTDYVRTDPDKKRQNNLLWLPVWVKATRTWVQPHGATNR